MLAPPIRDTSVPIDASGAAAEAVVSQEVPQKACRARDEERPRGPSRDAGVMAASGSRTASWHRPWRRRSPLLRRPVEPFEEVAVGGDVQVLGDPHGGVPEQA